MTRIARTAPATSTGYAAGITVIPTSANGVWTVVKGKAVLVPGNVTLNVVNGTLNSITVTNPATRRRVTRVEGQEARLVSLSLPSQQDRLTLSALVAGLSR